MYSKDQKQYFDREAVPSTSMKMLIAAGAGDWEQAEKLRTELSSQLGQDLSKYFSDFVDWDLRQYARLLQTGNKRQLAVEVIKQADDFAAKTRSSQN
jgi:hypothetical protein